MSNIKLKKLNNQIQQEVSLIINREIKDKEIEFVTVTGVETASDLSRAKVYITTLNDNDIEKTLNALEKAAPFIRTLLSKRLIIRHTPELKFLYDDSIAYGRKIDEVLKDIKEKEIK